MIHIPKFRKNINDGQVTSNSSSHPLGTILGIVAGLVAGFCGAIVLSAAIGLMPSDFALTMGACVGSVIGALAGHTMAAEINPKKEDLFWRDNHNITSETLANIDSDNYQPAYLYGIDTYMKYPGNDFSVIEPGLRDGWYTSRRNSELSWDDAKFATRDAYERLRSHEAMATSA